MRPPSGLQQQGRRLQRRQAYRGPWQDRGLGLQGYQGLAAYLVNWFLQIGLRHQACWLRGLRTRLAARVQG